MVSRRLPHSAAKDVESTTYQPPNAEGLDIEVFTIEDLMRRSAEVRRGRVERLQFHLIACITAGQAMHTVDFQTRRYARGSVLTVAPGQIQRFDPAASWKGWIVIFRPEFLQPAGARSPVRELEVYQQLQALPAHLPIAATEHAALIEVFTRMRRDAQSDADRGVLHSLLRSQLHTLLVRLFLVHASQLPAGQDTAALERCRRFRQLLEEHFMDWHHISAYARKLGYSEKSLWRATNEVAGLTPKAMLTARLLLEAKRYLAHTDLDVATISNKLGFDEPTNFSKFFKREVGDAPGRFRDSEHQILNSA
jgi:AraC-like DNA-binding protein